MTTTTELDIATAIEDYRKAVQAVRGLKAQLDTARRVVSELEQQTHRAGQVATEASHAVMVAIRGDDLPVPAGW